MKRWDAAIYYLRLHSEESLRYFDENERRNRCRQRRRDGDIDKVDDIELILSYGFAENDDPTWRALSMYADFIDAQFRRAESTNFANEFGWQNIKALDGDPSVVHALFFFEFILKVIELKIFKMLY